MYSHNITLVLKGGEQSVFMLWSDKSLVQVPSSNIYIYIIFFYLHNLLFSSLSLVYTFICEAFLPLNKEISNFNEMKWKKFY